MSVFTSNTSNKFMRFHCEMVTWVLRTFILPSCSSSFRLIFGSVSIIFNHQHLVGRFRYMLALLEIIVNLFIKSKCIGTWIVHSHFYLVVCFVMIRVVYSTHCRCIPLFFGKWKIGNRGSWQWHQCLVIKGHIERCQLFAQIIKTSCLCLQCFFTMKLYLLVKLMLIIHKKLIREEQQSF